MRRLLTGLFLFLHGLAHSATGMAAQDLQSGASFAFTRPAMLVLATMLLAIALPGFVAAGLGRFGVRFFERHFDCIVYASVAGSVLLLVLFGRSTVESGLGIALDMVAVQLTGLRIFGRARPPLRPATRPS